MLTPEQAQQRLQAALIPELEKWRLEAIAALPDDPLTEKVRKVFLRWFKPDDTIVTSLRQIAYGLINYDAQGKRIGHHFSYEKSQSNYHACVDALDALTPQNRIQIFQVFFPRIADHIEQVWQFLPHLPYQIGYTRKAFRAPGHEDIYLSARGNLLQTFLSTVGIYQEDIYWYAAHAAYLNRGYGADRLGILFAAVIDNGGEIGDTVFNTLLASGRGEHETGAMGRHVTRGLLSAARPDGWEFVEKLLLAAQREEGLRQVVLEAVDEAHPQAFQRMLRLILDHNLSRFSAITRAMNVWLGYSWDSENTRSINTVLEQVLNLLESADARQEALKNGTGEAVYLALWATAVEDTFAAITAAVMLLDDPVIERRFAAVCLLGNLGLEQSNRALIPALGDSDLRVAFTACEYLRQIPSDAGVFEALEALLLRMPDPKTFALSQPVIWPWRIVALERETVASSLIRALEDRSPKRLLPYLPYFTGYSHVLAAHELIKVGFGDAEVRPILVKWIGGRDSYLSHQLLELMEKNKESIQSEESLYLESLLTRKSDGLRRGVLSLLSNQKDKIALASAERLTASRKTEQRMAGLELLHVLTQKERAVQECRVRAAQYRQTRAELTDAENNLIEAIIRPQSEQPTLANAFGLMNPAGRTRPTAPRKRKVQMTSKAAVASLLSLDKLIHQHRSTAMLVRTWQGENQEVLLGNALHHFPVTNIKEPIEADVSRLPLREVWEHWVETRSGDLLDDDGLELVRARLQLHKFDRTQTLPWLEALDAEEKTHLKLDYRPILDTVLSWLIRLYPAPNTADFWLDSMETAWSELSGEALRGKEDNYGHHYDWRTANTSARECLNIVRYYYATNGSDWEDLHHIRLWGLLRWMDEPIADVPRYRPALEEVMKAHRLGVATDDDLYDQLLGPRRIDHIGYATGFNDLQRLSSRKPHALFDECPILRSIFERCRERVLQVELQRGDIPNDATNAAISLNSVPGTFWFIRILKTLGKQDIARERYGQSRVVSLSHLLRVSVPAQNETLELFAQSVKDARLSDERLIEAAVYSPQWATFVEHATGWKGAAEAIWWLHAHTKDSKWFIDQEIRDEWAASVSERTPLSNQDLLEGAVDIDWFWRVYRTLGAQRWETIYNAAKYSSSGVGHNRAKQFADAMLGKLDQPALVKRILDKRHQDSVCALGLLPLPRRKPDNEILKRYQTLQEFLRGSRKFGSQRRESEKLAVQIGLENLARGAGYPDPARLGWAMEAREVADLRTGAIRKTVEDVSLTLSINLLGKSQLSIERAGKVIKALPAKLKKAPDFVELRERKAQIDKQHSRMRLSLETAMCRADSFSGKELVTLLEHPVLAPMLEQLIFIGDNVIGYPVEAGQAIIRHDGSTVAINADTSLRIAHPYDLFQSGEWHLWQRDCFLGERIQPFKQVFRELYLLTDAERQDGAISRRYAGHQVQPRQAIALLGSRGWIAHRDYGVQKTFHRRNLSAHISFMGGYFTPADVEGLTLEGVLFTDPGKWQPLQLSDLDPILFSEVMRDLDLVVSVAHRGGVDPEATASTVEMRTALLRETCRLLKVPNVELRGSHALIEGKLGSYSVHLGSAIVHRQPGGALCIIPVHAQHRGRIFLPFADDDPKTAEVISKVLLLARDADIKDPTILEQIFAKG